MSLCIRHLGVDVVKGYTIQLNVRAQHFCATTERSVRPVEHLSAAFLDGIVGWCVSFCRRLTRV
eukprot:4357688-Lingulodinium_polyedra.AAC.1